MSDLIIVPGLPDDLAVMPPEPTGPDDPERVAKVQAWIRWAERVYAHRLERWAICEGLVPGYSVEREREREKILCRESSLYLATMYLHIYETDPDRLALYPWHKPEHGGWLPAIPFWYLARMFHWLDDRLAGVDGLSNGIITKPRRMGISDACVNWGLAHWLTDVPFSVKFVSRNMSLVYDRNNMDALIQRAAAKLSGEPGNAPIPGWLLPPGWDESCIVEPKIVRPDNRNLIGGEATTGTAGRGGRSTVAFIDEAAVMGKTLNRIVGAVQATSPHVILVSSETTEEGPEFVEMVRQAEQESPESVFVLEWWMHPFQDREWLTAEEQRYIRQGNHLAFFREILRQPYAGDQGWMYPDAREMWERRKPGRLTEAVDPFTHADHARLEVGMDPGFRDETALHWILVDPICRQDAVLESYEASAYPPEFYAAILAGADPADHPEFRWTPLSEEMAAYSRELREGGLPIKRICGDPSGKQSHGGRNVATGVDDDWYSRMYAFWVEHGYPVIPIVYNWSMKTGRYLQARRIALMEWLRSGRAVFNPTPGVERTLWALAYSKWDEQEKRITEMRDIVHDDKSHRRSAMEFWAVNQLESRATEGGRIDMTKAKRRNLAGFARRSEAA